MRGGDFGSAQKWRGVEGRRAGHGAGGEGGGSGRGSRRGRLGWRTRRGRALGRKGRGSASARNAVAAAAAAVAAAATAAAAALQLAPRFGLRRPAGERASARGQPPGRTTPAPRAPRRHRVHPGAAQAPRAGKEARPGGPGPVATADPRCRQPRGLRFPYGTTPGSPGPSSPLRAAAGVGGWVGGWWVCRAGFGIPPRAPGPSTRAPSHFGDLG